MGMFILISLLYACLSGQSLPKPSGGSMSRSISITSV